MNTKLVILLGKAPSPIAGVLFWSAILVLCALIIAVVFYAFWRRMRREEEPTVTTGFTLPDLRDLHKAGQLTDEEFQNAKAMLLARSRAEMAAEEAAAAADSADPASR
ncbi:MAG: SHOCT domain-containing protein [Planctomycetota bacterium]